MSSADDDTPNEKRQRLDSSQVFTDFELGRVLKEQADRKTIFVQGTFGDDGEKRDAVVILEKVAFQPRDVEDILSSSATTCEKLFHNDVYSNFLVYPPAKLNAIKTSMVYPASKKHLEKYEDQDLHVIHETWEDYEKVVLPYIKDQSFSHQWVYNILDKKSEAERIVFEDDDKDTGFILLPDMKWDGKTKETLYLVAICHTRNVGCLRDLGEDHLPLLHNILGKGKEAILDKYGLDPHQLRVYLHYQPSYYHLHVHFTYIKYEGPGQQWDKAHGLADVIDNITLYPRYYQRRTLTYVLKGRERLYQAFLTHRGET